MSSFPRIRDVKGRRKSEIDQKYCDQLSRIEKKLESLEKQIKKLSVSTDTQAAKEQMLLWQIHRFPDESFDESRQRFYRALPPATGEIGKMQVAGLVLLCAFDRICRENDIKYWLSFGSLLGAIRHGGFIPWDDDTDVCMTRSELSRFKEAVSGSDDFLIKNFFVSDPKVPFMNMCTQLHFKNYRVSCCLDIFVYDYCIQYDESTLSRRAEIRKAWVDEAVQAYLDESYTGFVANEPDTVLNTIYKKHASIAEEQLGLTNDDDKASAIIWSMENFNYAPALRSVIPIEDMMPFSEVEFEGHPFLAPKESEKYLRCVYIDYLSLPDDILSHRHFHPTPAMLQALDGIARELAPKYI